MKSAESAPIQVIAFLTPSPNSGLCRSPVTTVSSSIPRTSPISLAFRRFPSPCSRSRLTLELLILRQQRPDDPSHFVGEGHCCDLVRFAGEQRRRPLRR